MVKALTFLVLFLYVLISASYAQGNAANTEVPGDLKITLSVSGTIQIATHYTYTILSDGSISLEYQRQGLPVVHRPPLELFTLNGKAVKKAPAPPTVPQKKKHLSKTDLESLVRAFETSGFFEMADRYEGDWTVPNATCVNHAEEKGLSITSNGRTKSVSFFMGCAYGEASPLKRFLALYDTVSKAMNNVEVKTIEPPKPRS